MSSVYARLPPQPFASVTPTVKPALPGVVGVPVSAPPESSASPAGSAPALRANTNGPVPAPAVRVWL